MCGIVGYTPLTADYDRITRADAFQRLFDESCIRGLHAYGISHLKSSLWTYRTFDAKEIPYYFEGDRPTIAHARYCQSGDWHVLENNQPIVVGQTALAFNGCIHMGTKEEFEAAFDVRCETDNDGEIFLCKTADAVDAEEFVRKASGFVETISGSFAGVCLAFGQLIVSHNARRPLWRCEAHGARWYASTADIFRRAGFTGATPVAVGTEMA